MRWWTRRRVVLTVALIALVVGVVLWWFGDWLGFDRFLENGDKVSSILSFLLAAFLAARSLREERPSGRRLPRVVKDLVDRKDESGQLRRELRSRRPRIVVVTGKAGVGKTELVRRVLAGTDRQWSDATPLAPPTVAMFLGELEGRAAAPQVGDDASWQGKLTVALQSLGAKRVVFVIDSAEQLLGDDRKLTDLALDEALEIIAGEPRHRVKVVLIAKEPPVAFRECEGDWARTAAHIAVDGLPPEYFRQFVRERDAGNGLASLDDDHLDEVRRHLGGRPRLAQLFDAIVENSGVDAAELAAKVHVWAGQDCDVEAVAARLRDGVTTTLRSQRRRVYRAVAAFGGPVSVSMVTALVNRGCERHEQLPPDDVREELEALSGNVLHRLGADLYVLPATEARRALGGAAGDPTDQADRRLLLDAAELRRQWRLAEGRPERVDPVAALAEVDALLRGDFVEAAHRSITELDPGRRGGAPDLLFRRPREEIAERLTADDRRADNYNVLGYLHYLSGDFDPSRKAYRKVLEIGAGQASVQAKVYLNLAWLYWSDGFVESARCDFERARRLAPSDEVVEVGALEGLARCYRRRGLFGQAMETMAEALDVAPPRSPDFMRIAVRLLRLHLDLAEVAVEGSHAHPGGRVDEAEALLPRLREVVDRHPEPALRAVLLDAVADVRLAQGRLKQALSSAQEAAKLALEAHDPVTALQAQATVCIVRLRQGDWLAAAREAARTERYAGMDHSLLGTALRVVAARRAGRSDDARAATDHLCRQAELRVARDEEDFASWEFVGLARCARHLDGQGAIDDAVGAFRRAWRRGRERPAALVERTEFLVATLGKDSAERQRLSPALDVLKAASPANPVPSQSADG